MLTSKLPRVQIKLWTIPDGGLTANLNQWTVELVGHTKKVSHCQWHPSAAGILVSSGHDFRVTRVAVFLPVDYNRTIRFNCSLFMELYSLRWRTRLAQWCHLANDDESYGGEQGYLSGTLTEVNVRRPWVALGRCGLESLNDRLFSQSSFFVLSCNESNQSNNELVADNSVIKSVPQGSYRVVNTSQ